MNKKGFTLIELLAVIVVLAIVLIIAVPRILKVIESSEKETFRITGENLVKAAGDRAVISDVIGPKTYTIENGVFVGETLPMNGKLPESGTVIVNDRGEVFLTAKNDKYCIRKTEPGQKVTIDTSTTYCTLNIPESVEDSCFTRTNDGAQITITAYSTTCPKNVIIPEILDDLPVRIIGASAFNSRGLTSLTLPNTITTLNNYAFRYNQLTSVKIPNSVNTIGTQTFLGNNLVNVVLEDGLTLIGGLMFVNNQLTDVFIPSSVKTIGAAPFNNNLFPDENAFLYARRADGTYDLTTVIGYSGSKRDNVVIPDSVRTLGSYALYNNQLTNVTLPSGLVTIGSYALQSNQLTNIVLPSGLVTIGSYAFSSNQLTSIDLPNTVKTIGSHAFRINFLASLTIPTSVTSIGSAAFNNNSLPDNQAFIYARNTNGSENQTTVVSYGGAKRDNIIIPSNITNVATYSFYANNITSLTIPESVTTIGTYAFSTNRLKTLVIPNTVTTLDNYSLSSNQLTSITLPANLAIVTTTVSPTFYTAYVTNNGSTGGTYTAPSQSGVWTKQ